MQEVSQEFAESQVMKKYTKLYSCLQDLVNALNVMEPGGTLVDDITFTTKEDGKIQIAYIATPIQLVIKMPEREFILRVIEHRSSDKYFKAPARKILKQSRERTL